MSDSDPITRLNAALEGRYRIESELGEGGMANVYLADDLKHGRKVALKVLKPELAAVVGAERFLAEIRTTAKLQHPNILPLFDSGEADSYVFYVMPYVEGESLREKLDREHQLPVDEAVRITSEVADALQAAHENGVVHRDIKPANILLSRGRPLVADFGIALAVSAAGGTRLTETGLSLGTPYYMSPEQATGDQATGPATDTYALACVLYELLVGEPPYTGSTAQAILGKIITGGPVSATETRASVPANVDAAIRKALEKLPADRFASARDFAKALADPGFRHGETAGGVSVGSASPWNRLTIAMTAVAAGLLLTLAPAVLVLSSRPSELPTPEVVRFSTALGQDDVVYLGGQDAGTGRPTLTSLALSPDGKLLVYSATDGEGSRLYRQRLDREGAEPIAGTEDGTAPVFSPDGAWIGFFGQAGLQRVSVADGVIETIIDGENLYRGTYGLTWGDNGTIVIALGDELIRVPATGGEPELLAEADPSPGEITHFGRPHMLPGSEVVLFQVERSLNPEDAEIVALDLATGMQKTVLENAMDPRYVETGHLLYMREGMLMAVAFDPERLEVQGQPVIMVEDVMHSIFLPSRGPTGAGQVAVSSSGHLAYVRGGVYPETLSTAVRVTASGDTIPLEMDRRAYGQFRLSPDGNRLAFVAKTRGRQEIWVHNLSRGITEGVNTGSFLNWPLAWSPDGLSLAVSLDRDQALENVYRVRVDGTGEPERLAPSERQQTVSSWSSQGVIAWLEAGDIWVLPPDGDPAPFFTSETREEFPTFSPDGQWLAYASNRSGQRAVYVRPYPGPEPATRISVDGESGGHPLWSRDGRQIYYTEFSSGHAVLMAVDVTPGADFQVGRAAPRIEPFPFTRNPVPGHDIFPDGSVLTTVAPRNSGDGPQRLRRLEQVGAIELHVVLNWFEELKERVGN